MTAAIRAWLSTLPVGAGGVIMLTTHTFHAGELTLSYVEGPDNGPPLVMLHGVNGRWQALEPVMRAFADQWHVYACDLRGHGASGRAPSPGAYLVRDYGRDIEALVRGVLPGDEAVALMGFSLGAMVALGTAAALPDRIRALVLVEPPLMLRNHRFRELPIAPLMELAYETTRRRPTFDELLATTRSVMPDADETIVLAIAAQLSEIDPAVTDPDGLDRALDGLDLDAMLEAIPCPILLVHGEPALGSLVLEDDIAWARRHARDIAIVPVPGSGHDIPVEIVIERSRPFLAAVR